MASGDAARPPDNVALPANFDASYLANFMQRKDSVDSTNSMPGSSMMEEEYKFTEVSHPAQVLTGLNHLRNSQQFCDIVLLAGGQEFNCHKIVLASFSPYFHAMFTGNLAESTQDRVTINDLEASVMELLVNYGYTSEILINRQNVQALLSASNLLEILPVKEACGQYLEQNMDETNCIGIHCFAEAHACCELQQKSKDYILEHFTSVSLQEEYLQLNKEKLIEFLKDENLNVDNEESVFQSAVRWLDYDSEGRKGDFDKVLENVRLPLMSPYFLFDVVEKQEIVNTSDRCKYLVDEAKTFQLLRDRHAELQSPRTQLRRSFGYKEVIICVGGEDDKVVLRSVEMFDTGLCRWTPLACLPFAISKHGMVASGDYIYLAGGEFPDGSASRSMWRFDQNLDSWLEMVPMNMARSELGLAMLDGHVYAIGGWDGSSRLDSVEKYNPEQNMWVFIPPMKIALTSPAVVSMKGMLYVTGGAVLEDGDGIDLVQCYNPRTDMWIDRPNMQIPRSGSASCVLDGLIYVIGGWHASTENTNKVECYDPERNEWGQRAPMIERRYRPGVAIVNKKIYVCGGEEGWDRYHDTIECYDPVRDTWEIVGEMLTSRSWLSCVAITIRKDMNNAECHNKCECSV
ncbi:kelch-like protein 3 [Mya arenaria]|uniref:kelch-like protein 3 n=1 Tax=Mya arenaria TaxID=6604 RepID=UPI0022E07C8D|nr:kelch-like protein 3 [Mya arenaria]XP_052772655.1 kelch-like protein 3 [Mya arenaria]